MAPIGSTWPTPNRIVDRLREDVHRAHAFMAGGSIEDPGVIHEARRAVTRARGLLRLLAPEFDPARADVDGVLRRFLHGLASRRDAHVALEAAAALIPHARCEAERASLRRCMRLIESDPAIVAARSPFRSEAQGPACGHLDAVNEALMLLEDDLLSGASPREAFVATYRRARRRMKAARWSPGAPALHAWRRQVRHLRTQANLLAVESPGLAVLAESGRLDRLAGILGDHHDFSLLLEATASMTDRRDRKRVRRVLCRRQARLRERSLRLGRRVLRERAAALRARLGPQGPAPTPESGRTGEAPHPYSRIA